MNVLVKELENDSNQIKNVQKFLFEQIRKEFGYGYVPEYHKDIIYLKEFYLVPKRNIFLIAVDADLNKIVATIGLRSYDKDFEEFRDVYSNESTSSIWRLFVDDGYRRCGIARQLVNVMEDFAKDNGYDKIYLHTHRYLDAALPFWKSLGYKITVEEDDYDETIHMIKFLG